MSTSNYVFTAGEQKKQDVGFRYFGILSDGGFPVDVKFNYENGASELEKGVQGGFYKEASSSNYSGFEVTSANAQTLQIYYGNDKATFLRLSGTVSISNIVNVLNTNPIGNPAIVVDKGDSYGASYKSNTALAANTAEQVFSAAANVNGAIIHSAAFSSSSSGNILGSLIAKATAPATNIDGDIILSTDAWAANAAFVLQAASLKRPIKIPAGKGLFYIASQIETSALRSVLYTLL